MEIRNVEDVKALCEFQKLKAIECIELKIKHYGYVPAIVCGVLMLWAFWATWVGVLWSPMHFVLVAVAIAIVGHANAKRLDLLGQLFALRYENSK